ncbi:MAG: hypothetical protein AAF705_20010 [Bacteroidota bacterium]
MQYSFLIVLFSYLALNLLSGLLVFSVWYLSKEKGIKDTREFLLLLFFPAYGFGNWKFNQEVRSKREVTQSKGWFLNEYMLRVHKVFIWVMVFVFFQHQNALWGFNYIGQEWVNEMGGSTFIGVGLLIDVGIGLVGGLVVLFNTIVCIVVLNFVLFKLPKRFWGIVDKRNEFH